MIAPKRKEQTALRCQKHFEELLERYTGLAMQTMIPQFPYINWTENPDVARTCIEIAEKVANAVIERESEITW